MSDSLKTHVLEEKEAPGATDSILPDIRFSAAAPDDGGDDPIYLTISNTDDGGDELTEEEEAFVEEMEVMEEIAAAAEEAYRRSESSESGEASYNYRRRKPKPSVKELGTLSMGDIGSRYVLFFIQSIRVLACAMRI